MTNKSLKLSLPTSPFYWLKTTKAKTRKRKKKKRPKRIKDLAKANGESRVERYSDPHLLVRSDVSPTTCWRTTSRFDAIPSTSFHSKRTEGIWGIRDTWIQKTKAQGQALCDLNQSPCAWTSGPSSVKWKFSISIPTQQKASYYFRLYFTYFAIFYMKKMR